MYTLNLDTLSESRLQNAVNHEIFLLGSTLFQEQRVEVIELLEFSALCSVHDKRNHQVRIKVSENQLTLKCTCRHANRGLICEHDVAAWLGIREKLNRKIPPLWKVDLDRTIEEAIVHFQPEKLTQFLLLFSLQTEDFLADDWRIIPYYLPIEKLSIDQREIMHSLLSENMVDILEVLPEIRTQFRIPHLLLDMDSALNCRSEAVNLANVLIDLNRSLQLNSISIISLPDLLSLFQRSEILLYFGNKNTPLGKRLIFFKEPLKVCLNLNFDNEGLVINPVMDGFEFPFNFSMDQTEVIAESPPWILHDPFIFRLENSSSLSLLKSYSSRGDLKVTQEQIEHFANQYLIELARYFRLSGNAISWSEINVEPTPRVYLSDLNGELQVQLRFGYGDIELSELSDSSEVVVQQKPGSLNLVKIFRKMEAERNATELLITPGIGLKRVPFSAETNTYRLRARKHPIDFLLNSLPNLLKSDFEIYGEEQLRTARVNRNTPTISFRVSSEIDWFDVKTVVKFGNIDVEMQDIRRLLRKKERFVKLIDGSIGEIPEFWLEQYSRLFHLGDYSKDSLRLSRYHVSLIDQALGYADTVEVDRTFDDYRNKLEKIRKSDFKGISPRILPYGFLGELRPYQKTGYDWLHFLHEYRLGGCLADDMGLGKTVQALVFLQSIYHGSSNNPGKASLLVVPRSLLVNWQREAHRFTPEIKILEFFEAQRTKDTSEFDKFDLVITTYGVMLRDIQLLHGYNFYYAILDESQAIKNPFSQTARASHLLQANHRLVLTGTPIENSTAELWSQFNFLNPGLLGSFNYFKSEFGIPIERKYDEKALKALRKIVFPFILRRSKDQVAPELPPRTERILFSDMEPAQIKLYQKTLDYYRNIFIGITDLESLNNSRMRILEGLLRLRQIANHPALVDDKYRGGSGKLELLIDTLETLRAEGHKALVFSQFVHMLSLVRKEMEYREMHYTYLDGQTTSRQEQVDIFQSNNDISFFVISLKAGGLGLNLTAADYVIHIDPWWNPAVEMQASDRTHRIGQEKPVFVFKLIARDSVEEKILQLQEKKRQLVGQIITSENAFFKNLTKEDITLLFSE